MLKILKFGRSFFCIKLEKPFTAKSDSKKILLESKHKLNKGNALKLVKFGGYVTSECNEWNKIENKANEGKK